MKSLKNTTLAASFLLASCTFEAVPEYCPNQESYVDEEGRVRCVSDIVDMSNDGVNEVIDIGRDMTVEMDMPKDLGNKDMESDMNSLDMDMKPDMNSIDMKEEMDMGSDMTIVDMGPTCVDGPMELAILKTNAGTKLSLKAGDDVRVDGNDYRTFGEPGVDLENLSNVLPMAGTLDIELLTHRRLSSDSNFVATVHAIMSTGSLQANTNVIGARVIHRSFGFNESGTIINVNPSVEVYGTWNGQNVLGRGNSSDPKDAVVISYHPMTGAWRMLNNRTFVDQPKPLCQATMAGFQIFQ